MNWKIIIMILVFSICISSSFSSKPRKFKKATDNEKKFSNLKEKLERLQEVEAELEAELEEELEEEIDSEAGSVRGIIDFPSISQDLETIEDEEIKDPCQEVYCGAGRECIINEKGEGVCQCQELCENIEDDRRKVCSNHNETWISDCELYRMRCLCSEGSELCSSEKYAHVHIDYYGGCQEVPICEAEEMADFPRRMREWLFNIMRDMADREELSNHYIELEKKSEYNERQKWVNAAVWKWCELDGYPKDRSVSRHELFPLRAPLYTLEHCIAPFLDSCDPDGDHYISLTEWSECLQLTEALTEDMDDLCEDIRE